MKPFRFSLQAIRVLREQKERTAQQRFGEAMRACEAAAAQLRLASDELASAWAALGGELAAGVTASRLARTRNWCQALEARQRECAQAVEAARRAMDVVWQELLLATRERQAIDNYHDRCRRAYDREARREEQKRLDELGVRRARIPSLLPGPNHRHSVDL